MYSLRKRVWASFLVVGMLLALIILLGLRQYVLSGQYAALIEQSERAIFQFATLRESVTDSLVDANWKRLEPVIPEIEKLHSDLTRLHENGLIPTEFKLAMVDKVDLAGIIITIRRLMDGGENAEQAKSLQEQMRFIADRLLRYDRIIVSQARGRILRFQMVIIGTMGLIISLASFSLNRLYRNNVVPLLSISHQLQSAGQLSEEIQCGPDTSREVADLVEEIRKLAANAGQADKYAVSGESSLQHAILADMINETTNQLNGIINYAQIIADDADRDLSDRQREMLHKIIDSGQNIAKTWQKIH
jgi:hypothetical protein